MSPDSGNTRHPPLAFADALAAYRAQDPDRLRFVINTSGYLSVKDIVVNGARVCPVCHFPLGTPGLVRMDWPVGHPHFGQPVRCPRCNDTPPRAPDEDGG